MFLFWELIEPEKGLKKFLRVSISDMSRNSNCEKKYRGLNHAAQLTASSL